MKNSKYLLLFLLYINLFYSQNHKTDTLGKYTYEELENKFYSYKDNGKIESSKIIAKYYLHKAKENKDEKHLADGFVFIQYNQDLPIALKYIDSLEIVSKNLKDNRYPARIYLLKGLCYNKFDNLKLALENFIMCLKYAKEKNNLRQISIVELQIAYLNSYIGKHTEAVKVLEYYYNNPKSLTEQDVMHIQINLADTYLDIGEYEKAFILIRNGLANTSKNHEELRYNRYLSLLGNYYLQKGKYNLAISPLEKCKKYFLKNDIPLSANYVMLYLGESYSRLKNKKKAIENFNRIDSIVQKTNNTFPELHYAYSHLIDYYKEKNDKEKQLYYIERFLKVDAVLDSQFKYISRELPRKYDTPKLLSAKEEIIRELNHKKHSSYVVSSLLCLMLLTLLFLFIKSKRKEKEYKKVAQDLIKSVNNNVIHVIDDIHNKIVPEKQVFDSEKNKLSEDIINTILQGLKTFEEKEQFLKQGTTLSSLAKKIKTNSTYLSQVVNTYKEKNFAIYLNDLRIDYALNRLVKDKKFRSYKLSVIAEELGYNNEQAFAMAFKKRTGTTLSIYLKEVESQSQNSLKQ